MKKLILLILITIFSFQMFAQTVKLKGKVLDSRGKSVPNAQIKLGDDLETTTDSEGNYTIEVSISDTLVFQSEGKDDEKIIVEDDKNLDVFLAPTSEKNKTTVTFDEETVVSIDLGIGGVDGYAGFDDGTTADGVTSDKTTAWSKTTTKKSDNIIKSGLLTAGETHDFSKWNLWQDITENELNLYISMWDFHPIERYCVQLSSENGNPIIDSKVELISKQGETIWTARTDNTGKAELWANMFPEKTDYKGKYSIKIDYNGKKYTIKKPTPFHKGINHYVLNAECNTPENIDIAFVVDATGSMGDEIKYLQEELGDVITRIYEKNPMLNINIASVFYKDVRDDYLTIKYGFSNVLRNAMGFIKKQSAEGGGDFPEAVHSGLQSAINELDWSENARTRIIFLVLDAPPHNEQVVVDSLQNLIQTASEKGIRIVPITCSGIDKSTEYLMRAMALATNGTYVFLTDDSGIGDSHIEPTTDEWKVETLNDLMVRLITQYITTPTCDNTIIFDKEEIKDTTIVSTPHEIVLDSNFVQNIDSANVETVDIEEYNYDEGLKYYPNPTRGNLTIEITGEIKELFLADYSGKILQRFSENREDKINIEIGQYPSGIYFIQYLNKDRLMSGKVILIH